MARITFGRRAARRGGRCLLCAGILVGGMGLSCDQNAQAVFRQTAVPEIAAGLTSAYGGTFFNAIVNGLSAAILNAGDGPTDSGS